MAEAQKWIDQRPITAEMIFRPWMLMLTLGALSSSKSYGQDLLLRRTIYLGQGPQIEVETEDSWGTNRPQQQNYRPSYYPTRSQWAQAENERKLKMLEEIFDEFSRDDSRSRRGMSDSDRKHREAFEKEGKDLDDEMEELLRPLKEEIPKFEKILQKKIEQAKLQLEQRRIRNDIDRTLELLRTNSQNIDIVEKSRYALETLHDADRYSYEPETRYLSERLTRRAEGIYADLSPGNSESVQGDILSTAARNAFGVGNVDGGTFAGREIINVANEAFLNPGIIDSDVLRFHISSALNSAQMESTKGNWRSALNNIDRAWNVVDYSRGLVKGLYEFGTDTAQGLAHLATHPIDSAEAMYDSIVNYDRTYGVIKSSLAKIWNEYDGYSTEEKGKLHSKMAAEIASAFFAVGMVKRTANFGKLTQAVEKAAQESVRASQMARNSGGMWNWVRDKFGWGGKAARETLDSAAMNRVFEAASSGGRHSGQLKEFLKQTPDQLKKSVSSFEKNIAKHEKYLEDPFSHVPDWNSYSIKHQENLRYHWKKDIDRAYELKHLAEKVLEQK